MEKELKQQLKDAIGKMSKQQLINALSEKNTLKSAVLKELGDSTDASKITSLAGTPEEKAAKLETLLYEAKSIKKSLDRIVKNEKEAKKSAKLTRQLADGKNPNFTPGTGKNDEAKRIKVPAQYRTVRSKVIGDDGMAYAAGMWMISTFGAKAGKNAEAKKATDWCNEHLNMKALDENFNETGGALVPYEFLPILVDLKEQYGKVRQNMNILPMSRDVMPFPRRNAHTTAYWVKNNQQPTESAPTFNNIELVAKKLFSWISLPFELLEDSAIAIGDWVMRDFAWAFSKAEDDAFLLGDGTETYGMVMGVKNSLLNLSGTIANIAGLQVASTKTWGSMVKSDISALQGRLPGYALPNAKFYCSLSFFFNVFQRLLYSQGGSPGVELRDSLGGDKKKLTFLYNGFEVVVCQNLPVIPDQVSDVVCYFGDLDLAGKFADRRQFTVNTSDQVLFLNDQLAIKATERVAMAVHDVGNASGTASARVAGPIVALITPTS